MYYVHVHVHPLPFEPTQYVSTWSIGPDNKSIVSVVFSRIIANDNELDIARELRVLVNMVYTS